MRRRKRHTPHVNHERWLVSYADFITLLFALFVVMYAASQVDNKRIGELSQAIQSAFKELGVFQASNSKLPAAGLSVMASTSKDPAASPDSSENESANLREMLAVALAPEIQNKQAELRDGPDGLVISLQEIGFYDQGSDTLKEASTGTLNRVVSVLKPTNLRVRIEGHTDDVPIHNARFASNWELSAARATGLVRVFIEKYGLDPTRLAAAGYAEYHPIQKNNSAEGRRVNRRVDIVVLDPPKKIPAQTRASTVQQLQQKISRPEPVSASPVVNKPSPGQ